MLVNYRVLKVLGDRSIPVGVIVGRNQESPVGEGYICRRDECSDLPAHVDQVACVLCEQLSVHATAFSLLVVPNALAQHFSLSPTAQLEIPNDHASAVAYVMSRMVLSDPFYMSRSGCVWRGNELPRAAA
jgi:hypothetical protein